MPARQEKKTTHIKAIINGKLYDTEKADFVCPFGGRSVLFKTKKGNYFSCKKNVFTHSERKQEEIIDTVETIYSDPEEETIEAVKSYIGIYEFELYIKLFGEVEEA